MILLIWFILVFNLRDHLCYHQYGSAYKKLQKRQYEITVQLKTHGLGMIRSWPFFATSNRQGKPIYCSYLWQCCGLFLLSLYILLAWYAASIRNCHKSRCTNNLSHDHDVICNPVISYKDSNMRASLPLLSWPWLLVYGYIYIIYQHMRFVLSLWYLILCYDIVKNVISMVYPHPMLLQHMRQHGSICLYNSPYSNST